MGRKFDAKLGAVGLTVVVSIAFLAVLVASDKNVIWDLQSTRSISAVNWPHDVEGSMFAIEGPHNVHLILPNGVAIRARTTFATVDRSGTEISGIALSYRNMDASTTESQLHQLIVDLGLRRNSSHEKAIMALKEWRREAAKNLSHPPNFTAGGNVGETEVFAQIHPSFDNRRPFFFSLEFSW